MQFDPLFDEFAERDWQRTTAGTLRFAVVGLGWWTLEEAVPAIHDADLCAVTTVVSGSKEKAQRIAAATDGVERGLTYDEFHDGAGAEGYDAVYVATPNAHHLPHAAAAADLGKAVLCEKPMEATVERAERLRDACEDAGVPLMIAYRMQTEPAVRRARDLLELGAIGEPVQVYGNNSQSVLSMIDDPDQWRLDPALSGYGTSMVDLGIYPINTTRFVLDSDPVSVSAQMASVHDAFGDVPDERSTATAVYEGGVHAAFTATQNGYADSELSITGTDGRLTLRPAFHMECELTLERDGVTVDAGAADVNEMTEEFDYFADRVLSGDEIYADGEHGLVDMQVLAAVHEAADTGETVALD